MHVERAIARYVTTGLSPGGEARLRRHLAGCARCRATYEREVRLVRALSGDVTTPSPDEERRARERALRALGLEAAMSESRGKEALRERLRERMLFLPWRELSLVAAAALVALVFVVSAREPAPILVAHVKDARGLSVDGEEAAPGQEIFSDARVEVARKGGGVLSLAVGGELRAYPGARLSLASVSDVTLDEGKIWLVLPKLEGDLAVHTPAATARVVGTSFLVVHEGEETDVRVVEGAVEVRSEKTASSQKTANEPVLVKANERTRIERGRAPGPVTTYAPKQDVDEWQRFWTELLRSIREGIRKGLESLGEALKPR